MPGHYGKDKKMPKKGTGNGSMLDKAVKDGLLTQKQRDKLPPHLLEAIVKKKKGMKKK